MKTITTSVTACARCGGDHLEVEFTPFVRPPSDATHWGQCQKTGDPILMLVRDKDAPAIGPDTPVPSYHLAYAINVGLALYGAIRNGDTAGVTDYGEKLLRLTMRWNAPQKCVSSQ
jgi:hypothetical protein